MTMEALRQQVAITDWPVLLRVDGKDIPVGTRDELMVPSTGNLVCVYEEGAFRVMDCRHIATMRHVKSNHQQTA